MGEHSPKRCDAFGTLNPLSARLTGATPIRVKSAAVMCPRWRTSPAAGDVPKTG